MVYEDVMEDRFCKHSQFFPMERDITHNIHILGFVNRPKLHFFKKI